MIMIVVVLMVMGSIHERIRLEVRAPRVLKTL